MTFRPLGLAAIGLAVAFNLPFALLAGSFDYPDILRRPAGEVLDAFAAGGGGLVLTWYAFGLSALALVPFALGLAFSRPDWARRPALSVGGAIVGALAGLVQAVGLFRWVFAVPELARQHATAATDAARAATEAAFTLANLWGGVAVGEHLGQLLTVGWIGLVILSQLDDGRRIDRIGAVVGAVAAASITIGLGDGLSLALGAGQEIFSIATVIGYLAFSLWLVMLGIGFFGTAHHAPATSPT